MAFNIIKPSVEESRRMRSESILIIDDVECVHLALRRWLEEEGGYSVAGAHNETEGRSRVVHDRPDAVILDLDLTGSKTEIVPIRKTQGFRLLSWIKDKGQDRSIRDTPVLVLTGIDKTEEEIKHVTGQQLPCNASIAFSSGANEYMRKPYSGNEVLARLRKLMNERYPERFSSAVEFEFDGWKLNVENRELTSPDSKIVHLTNTEYHLLQLLVRNSRQLVSHEDLSFSAFDRELRPGERTIHQHMAQIRQKLGENSRNPPLIRTEHGRGYRFEADAKYVSG